MDGRHSETSKLIVMAGLPGTGKSTIAAALAERLNAVVLNKDIIRAKLFTGNSVDFSREQDDLCVRVMFLITDEILSVDPEKTVIIDGRTFSKRYQVEDLQSRARDLSVPFAIIECVCDDDVAKQRLDKDQRSRVHPAGNRNYALYRELKKQAEPIPIDRIVIDTGRESLEHSLERCLEYLKEVD